MGRRKKIAIVGAGIAGLTLARSLNGLADVTVFEKSRGVGGRMATRRLGEITFDHGAQYFTIRSAEFHAALETAIEQDVIETWTGIVASSKDRNPDDVGKRGVSPRFVGSPTMTALPKWLSRGLDVRLGAKVDAIRGSRSQWELTFGPDRNGPFDWVVAACPAPQALILLPEGFSGREPIASAKMNACFTLMITLNKPVIANYCAMRYDDDVIAWVADNSSKPERSATPSLVVHSQNKWADLHLAADPYLVRSAMLTNLAQLIPEISGNIASVDIHRWRFANVERASDHDLLIDFDQGLAACGDWTIGNRVEAAFLSAEKLSRALRASL